MIDNALAGIPAIGLDELVRRAALMARQDHKYLLALGNLPAFLNRLPADTMVLEIDGRRAFEYRSTYFDTRELDSYQSTAFGRRRRFKVRVRSYLDSQQHYLELKTRGCRGTTDKTRLPLDHEDQLLPPRQQLGQPSQRRVLAAVRQAGIRAVPQSRTWLWNTLTTRYRRSTLFVPSCHCRITIDTRLAWILPGGDACRPEGLAIVETKSPTYLSDIDRLLWSQSHRPCSLSKYGTGLALLRPELPSNRWHPVLHHQLQPASETR